MSYRAVFLDVANTLLDKPGLYPAVQNALGARGVNIPIAEIRFKHRLLSEAIDFPDRTSRQFYESFNATLLRSLGVIPEPALLEAIFFAASYLPWEPFQDDVALQQIELPLGVLSNWDSSLPERLTAIATSFTWVLGSHSEGVRKPDPTFFARILRVTGLAASEVLVVGDSIRLDIQPALASGFGACLIDRDGIFPHATVPRIESFEQLQGLL